MRGAGCTWNDIVDRDLDRSVERTRSRPIPSGQVSVAQAMVFLVLQALVGLAVLLSFNGFTVGLGIASLAIVAVYPFMKRITYWPQIVLGLAFSWGALMGWAAAFGRLDPPALLLYAGSIAWVIGYDTIYAHQDREDDALIGIKSTALLFGERTKPMLAVFYGLAVVLIGAAGLAAGAGSFFARRPPRLCRASGLADRPARYRRSGPLPRAVQIRPRCRADPVCGIYWLDAAVAPRSFEPRRLLIPGDDLALAAMDRGLRGSAQRGGAAGSRDGGGRSRCGGGGAQVGASIRTAPRRANGSRKLPSRSATRSGRPSTRPQDCHSATMSSLSLEENSGSDSAGSPCSSTTAMALGVSSALPVRRMATPRNAATGKFKRHAHAAHGAAQHHTLAMQVDDAQLLVGRLVGGLETHRQREGVEPQRAARPGSNPAGFHLTPRKLGSRRAVAARLPRECQSAGRNRLKNPG